MRHAVIMAGGSGTRLWPLSRSERPKQLLRLFEGRSLLRQSFERLRAVLPAEQIHVITGQRYVPAMREELPELPAANFMAEPCGRDTANAVGLAAHLLAGVDADATMGVFTADHIIRPVEQFASAVKAGFEMAEHCPDALVTFGITPRRPHTGYGYMQRGEPIAIGVYLVDDFKEKPDQDTAERYFRSGTYYWNSGMFCWRAGTILDHFARFQPELHAGLGEVAGLLRDGRDPARAAERFAGLQKISIDYAILERAERVLVVEMACEWMDVGSWTALVDVFLPDEAGDVRAAPRVTALDTSGNIFVSEADHRIAAIGVRDLVVVHSPDVTLICRREDAERIKEMVELVRREHGGVNHL